MAFRTVLALLALVCVAATQPAPALAADDPQVVASFPGEDTQLDVLTYTADNGVKVGILRIARRNNGSSIPFSAVKDDWRTIVNLVTDARDLDDDDFNNVGSLQDDPSADRGDDPPRLTISGGKTGVLLQVVSRKDGELRHLVPADEGERLLEALNAVQETLDK